MMTLTKRVFLILSLLTTLGIISQVSATAKNPPSKSEITINDSINHKQINLEKGKILMIKLSANPSTGYNWQIIKNDPQKLKPLGDSVFEPLPTAAGESQVKLIGSPENQVFRFLAQNSGSTQLKLQYSRAWEKNIPPIKTYQITVKIR